MEQKEMPFQTEKKEDTEKWEVASWCCQMEPQLIYDSMHFVIHAPVKKRQTQQTADTQTNTQTGFFLTGISAEQMLQLWLNWAAVCADDTKRAAEHKDMHIDFKESVKLSPPVVMPAF